MRHHTWGRKHERDIRAYAPGDVFFMHVTGRSEVVAMGMFTGRPYFDDDPLWAAMDGKGAFPWRIGVVAFGEEPERESWEQHILRGLERAALETKRPRGSRSRRRCCQSVPRTSVFP